MPKDDTITKQAIKYTERIIDVVKRIPSIAALKGAFELPITKMKRPDRLEKTDLVQSEVPSLLQPEMDEIN